MPTAIATLPESAPKRLYLVDGSGYIFRAYHSLPPLTRPDGTPVGAVYGFINMLLKLMDGMQQSTHLAVIFDAARKTFRNDIYPEYKAHRPPAPEDLIPQFPIVREATRALNIPAIELDNYEADDLIASYARIARAQGYEVVIVSSDKDLMQLVKEGISLLDPMKNKTIGKAEVLEKFGVAPELVVDAQALIGDASDNVPGVPGIGPKIAAELIGQFGSLEGVLNNTAQIKQAKRRESLEQFAEQARISRQLVELKSDVPLPEPLDALVLQAPVPEVLIPFLRQQNFKSLLTKAEEKFAAGGITVVQEAIAIEEPKKAEYVLVSDEATLTCWIAEAEAKGAVAVDTETTGLDALQVDLVGISLCIDAGKACYIPLAHITAGSGGANGDLFAAAPSLRAGQMPKEKVLKLLKPLLENQAVLKIGQNIKYDAHIFRRLGIEVSPVDDTMLLSYALDAGRGNHNMDELAQRHLNHNTIKYADVTGSGRNKITFAEVELGAARDYAAEDAEVTLRLHHILKTRLIEERLTRVYETLDRPLISVLLDMEATGITVDKSMLANISTDLAARAAVLEKQIHDMAGRSFTIASPKQLGEVLFDELKLPSAGKSSKTGSYTTDVDVLEGLAGQGYEIAQLVLDWRQMTKLRSTYTDALVQQINPNTGRVHTSYAMAIASTGRLSSTDPNLQNIPIRTEEGRKIRYAFVAAKGCKLVCADYSQIELRLLAHMANVSTLKQAFAEGRDIHALTASQMFGVPLEEITGELRRKAKAINFGIVYGMSAHGLATRQGISRTEAARYIEQYFAQYPGIKAYMDDRITYARQHGYVETLYGRRCHLKDINSKNGNMRSFNERVAINAPLQGTAADVMKRAMIHLHARLKAENSPARILLQVHDELVVETPEAYAEQTAKIVREEMQNAANFSVELTVDVNIGDNWGSIH